jgi:gluconokinase
MGVSGSGKTTIGKRLAEELGWPYYEGDDYHPIANIRKMSQGMPLTDEDRGPWLAALRKLIQELLQKNQPAVLSCSALKQSYRDRLQAGSKDVCFVYLRGSHELLQQRLRSRHGHYMQASLLASQLATLEEPAGALAVDVAQEPALIVAQIRRALGL